MPAYHLTLLPQAEGLEAAVVRVAQPLPCPLPPPLLDVVPCWQLFVACTGGEAIGGGPVGWGPALQGSCRTPCVCQEQLALDGCMGITHSFISGLVLGLGGWRLGQNNWCVVSLELVQLAASLPSTLSAQVARWATCYAAETESHARKHTCVA